MSTKEILITLGTLCAIIALAVFMFTASSVMFTVMSGIGCIAVMLIYDDYKKLLWEKKFHSQSPPKDLDKRD